MKERLKIALVGTCCALVFALGTLCAMPPAQAEAKAVQRVKIASVEVTTSSAKITIKKIPKAKYRYQLASSKSFASPRGKNSTKTSVTFKNLSQGAVYYARAKATVGKKSGSWSTPKKIVLKKAKRNEEERGQEREVEKPPTATPEQGYEYAVSKFEQGLQDRETQIDIPSKYFKPLYESKEYYSKLKTLLDGYDYSAIDRGEDGIDIVTWAGVSTSRITTVNGKETERAGRLYISYKYSEEELKKIGECAQTFRDKRGLSDVEKAVFIQDWMNRNVSYNYDAYNSNDYELYKDSYSAIGAFCNGTCVCQGYAEATMFACRWIGLPCRMAEVPSVHAWNLVQVDGSWYHFDTTWNIFLVSDEEISSYDSHGDFKLCPYNGAAVDVSCPENYHIASPIRLYYKSNDREFEGMATIVENAGPRGEVLKMDSGWTVWGGKKQAA